MRIRVHRQLKEAGSEHHVEVTVPRIPVKGDYITLAPTFGSEWYYVRAVILLADVDEPHPVADVLAVKADARRVQEAGLRPAPDPGDTEA